jgi:hypothetical protein
MLQVQVLPESPNNQLEGEPDKRAGAAWKAARADLAWGACPPPSARPGVVVQQQDTTSATWK